MLGCRRLRPVQAAAQFTTIVQYSQPGTCPSPGCDAPASLSEYGTICLRGHITDDRGTLPVGRTIDLALAVVPAVWRDAGQAMDLQKEIALLRELRTDVERWRENGGDGIDVGYILDTLDRLEESFPHPDAE